MTRIGQDEWVEQAGERIKRKRGVQGVMERATELIPPRLWIMVLFGVGMIVPAFLALPMISNDNQILAVAIEILLLALLGIGLNIVVGYSGMLDLGFVAFYGIGAYTYAFLSSDFTGLHLPTVPTLLIATAMGMGMGVLLGATSLRLRGDYLAIVTLAFGLAFANLMNSLTRVSLPGREDTVNLTGGPNGVTNLDDLSFLGFEVTTLNGYFIVLLVVLCVGLLVVYNINQSPLGRAWRSMREDDLAAQAMGMDTRRLRLQAFAIGATIAAFAGALFAARQGSVFPRNFETALLIRLYAVVVLGGIGSLPGVVLGAVVIGGGMELLRNTTVAGLIFYAVILLILWNTLKPRWKFPALLGATIAAGFLISMLAGLFAPPDTGEAGIFAYFGVPNALATDSLLAGPIRWWLVIPDQFRTLGNWGYVGMIAGVLAVSRFQHEWVRFGLLIPTLYCAVLAWELRLSQETSVTRLIFVGLMLVVLMIYRPSGLLGTRRVEIV